MPNQLNKPPLLIKLFKICILRGHAISAPAPTAGSVPHTCRLAPTPISPHFQLMAAPGSPATSRCRASKPILLAIILALVSTLAAAQWPDGPPATSDHDAHAKMNERGDKGMGSRRLQPPTTSC
jgi:hypothetical protein